MMTEDKRQSLAALSATCAMIALAPSSIMWIMARFGDRAVGQGAVALGVAILFGILALAGWTAALKVAYWLLGKMNDGH